MGRNPTEEREETTMSLTIRRATPAEEAVLVEFNHAIDGETEL